MTRDYAIIDFDLSEVILKATKNSFNIAIFCFLNFSKESFNNLIWLYKDAVTKQTNLTNWQLLPICISKVPGLNVIFLVCLTPSFFSHSCRLSAFFSVIKSQNANATKETRHHKNVLHLLKCCSCQGWTIAYKHY